MTVQYSPTEQALLDLLRDSDAELDTHQLADRYYTNGRERPWHAEIVIRNALKELIRKVDANREKFSVVRTEQPGNRAATFRFIRRGRVRA